MPRPRRVRGSAGFTLVELIVGVLIVGILAAVAVPQYLKTIETAKADDAVAMVNMIGTTNKMFALDHSGAYATGAFPSSGGCTVGTACPATGPFNACALVHCKYLANQDFGTKPYTYYACDGTTAACNGISGGNMVSTAQRKSGTYAAWGYGMNTMGVITANGGAPTPTY